MLTLFATLALSLAPTSVSEDAPVRVSYADLDLASTAGVATLDRRIANAIDVACPAWAEKRLAEIEAIKACRAEVSARLATLRTRALGQAAARTR